MTTKPKAATHETNLSVLRPDASRNVWWPEHRKVMREVLDAAPESAIELVNNYRERAKDPDRGVGGIYATVCALVRDGARISGPVRQQLHALMLHERSLRGAPKPRKTASTHDAREAPPPSSDVTLRALIKTWRAGNLSDAELLAALRGLTT